MTPDDDSTFGIAFVCTANRFRSPLAAAVARQVLEPLPVAITSAGIRNVGSAPALPAAVEAAAALGIDLAPHRAQLLEPGSLRSLALVVGFELAHVASAVIDGGAPRGRTFMLAELVRLIEQTVPDSSRDWRSRAEEVLVRLHPAHATSAEIPDPVREPRQRQNAIAREVVELTVRAASGLFGLPTDATAGGTHAAG